MRIGIYPSLCDQQGNLLDAAGLAARARMIEAAGLDGIWIGDHLPTPGDTTLGLPDPLAVLSVSAGATSRIEIGTNIYCVPTRNRYDLLQRFFTLETLHPRRFTIGVGTGSSSAEYEALGVPWEERFGILRSTMDEIREMARPPAGSRVGTTDPEMTGTWSQIVGLPRFVLGAWRSEAQLRRAATEYDGWMTSGFMGLEGVGWKKSFAETIQRYRDLGGTRAMVSTVQLDLHRRPSSSADQERFDLFCTPAEATDRLGYLAELGYDDVIVNRVPQVRPFRFGPHMSDHSTEDLEEIRSLVPKHAPVVDFGDPA